MTGMVGECFLSWFWMKKSLNVIRMPTIHTKKIVLPSIIVAQWHHSKQIWKIKRIRASSKILTRAIKIFLPPTSQKSGILNRKRNRRWKSFSGIQKTMISLGKIQIIMDIYPSLSKSSIYKTGLMPFIRMKKMERILPKAPVSI